MASILGIEIVEAIQGDRLVKYLRSLSKSDVENDEILQAASECVNNIGALAKRESARLKALLLDENIDANVRSSEKQQQRPRVDIEVEFRNIERSLSVLSNIGYRPWENWDSGAWASFKRSRTSIPLTKTGGEGVQLILHWPATLLHRIPEVLRPNKTDWSGMILSRKFWFMYYPLVIKRLALRIAKGRSSTRNLGPHLPTPIELVDPLLRHAGVNADDILLDVGSGDGSVSIAAAKTVGCRGLGVELDAHLVQKAVERAKQEGLSESLDFINSDIVDVDLSHCTAAFVFLPVEALKEIVGFLKKSLPQGSVIIAHEQHALPDSLNPDSVSPVFSAGALTIAHVWKI